jgi:hypothetical protein
MPWVESETEHFHCRHSSEFTADAARVLALLERTREQLAAHFRQQPEGLTMVLHDSPLSLALSNPIMPLLGGKPARSAQGHAAGWCGRQELHVLSPKALRERSSGVTGSYEMLALAPASLYARRVIIGSNEEISGLRVPARTLTEMRCAWMLDGISRWFSGETTYARGAIAQRMRGGRRPHFPPNARDAPLLAPPLIDQLAQLRGTAAVTDLASQLHRGNSKAVLTRAFSGRSLMTIESDWRSELRRIAEGR